MKIILSRKGFDLQFGKQPSPVLPDGTLLSLPIPREHDVVTYSDLLFNDKSYFNIIKELKPDTKINADDTCHLDPDIRKNIRTPYAGDRVSIFGQCDAALTLLKKYDVKKEDLFLFFGWFKETEYDTDGRLRYKSKSPDLHIIYGYLQIGEVCFCNEKYPDYAMHHAHAKGGFISKKNNGMYIATTALSVNESLPGSGCLRYSPDAVLTKEGMSRSKWKPHSFFKELPVTYHHANSYKTDYFQSAAQGQEFIMESNSELRRWVKKLLEDNKENLDDNNG